MEYRAVCRNLPENAHRTSNNSTRKEIPQQQTSPNVREPNPVGTFSGAIDDKQCYFICNGNFIRDGGVCRGITHDVNAGTITVTDGVNTYTIMDKNLGATVAGTGSNSYGHHFQRGNNFGFANT
ncbi:MAG: hypothetical protein LBD75_01030 [Candidatus Peribacteria bacterium]|nr:hypothetical protein [Candidatus Peribacteria bacterium]